MLAAMPVDRAIDARDQMCPMPVLMLAKAIKQLEPGQILAISATDQGAKKDIPAWAEKTGHRLLQMQEAQGVLTFYIQKAG
jgi:TusA-related sulfurtransferase